MITLMKPAARALAKRDLSTDWYPNLLHSFHSLLILIHVLLSLGHAFHIVKAHNLTFKLLGGPPHLWTLVVTRNMPIKSIGPPE